MPNANRVLTNLVGGELTPLMYGRIDLPIYQRSVAKCQNFIALAQGGAFYRTGSFFVNYTRLNQKAVFIPFQFSDVQSYLIEATEEKFRFYKDNGIILEAAKSITVVTNASPGVFTSVAHGYEDGDEVFIAGLTGTLGVNSRYYLVASKTADTFQLTQILGTPVDTTSVGTYSGDGGVVARIYEIDTPYKEEHLPFLQYAQSADTMYIAHQEYEPRKLVRLGHANWTINTYVRAADFIEDEDDYPRAVSFNDSGRLLFGGSKRNPQSIWASAAPSSGDTDFDNFQDGINATDAVIFTLAPLHGKVDAIEWLTQTAKFTVAGTFSGIRRIYGATEQEPLSPTSLTARSVNTFGCAYALPVSDGANLFYIQRGGQQIRSLEYDIQIDGYVTTDRNLVSEHLTKPGVTQVTQQQGQPNDIIWVTRNDGKLLGLTFKEREDISGWHRHLISGIHTNDNGQTVQHARVLNTGIMPRPFNGDQLWMIVERVINGGTIRSVEYRVDPIDYPSRNDYYSEATDDGEEADNLDFDNATYEFNKNAVYLDMALQYDGSELGVDSLETAFAITDISADDPAVVTAPGHNFVNGDLVYIQDLVQPGPELNNLFFEVADADIIAGTFTLIGQGDDIVIADKPRGKKKRKKKRDGTQIILTGPVDGSVLTAYDSGGTVARLGVTLTIFALTGATNIIASGPIFTADMVGREIWKSYDVNGDGGGRARITEFVSSTEVTTDIVDAVGFDNLNTIPVGGWLITTDSVSGIDHLEGTEVGVTVDGGPHIAKTVVNGSVTLERQASFACVGLGPYTGIITTLNLDAGGVTGSAQGKMRNLYKVMLRFLNTVGTLFGTDPYRLENVPFDYGVMNRPSKLFSGNVLITHVDRTSETNKQLHIVHKIAAPCTLLASDAFIDTTDE